MDITDIMRAPLIIEDTANFEQALAQLICNNTNSALVVDAEGKLVGEVSVLDLIKAVLPDYIERDSIAAHFATEAIFRDDIEKARKTPITQLMKKNPKTIGPDTPLVKSAVIAIEEGQSRIPVVDEDNRPMGVLTRTELKKVFGQFLDIEGCFTE